MLAQTPTGAEDKIFYGIFFRKNLITIMRFFLIIAALLYCSVVSSQIKAPEAIHKIEGPTRYTEKKIVEERIITCESIETDAQVKDQRHWLMYLSHSFLLDSLARDSIPEGIYNIMAYFIIDKEGCVTEVKVHNDPGYGLGSKVISVISRYNEKWNPATRNGRNVRAYKKQVVTIIVENKKCKLQEEFEEFIL